MKLEFKPLPEVYKLLDAILHPIMWAAHGFNAKGEVQQTHPWHCTKINPNSLDHSLTVCVKGNEDISHWAKFKKFPIFHLPIFGGWKDYVLLGHTLEEIPHAWHIGWIFKDKNEAKYSELNRIPISDKFAKLLKGPKGSETTFFAVDAKGNQIPIEIVDEGKLFDGKYPHTKLL